MKFSFEDMSQKEADKIFNDKEDLQLNFETALHFTEDYTHIAVDIHFHLHHPSSNKDLITHVGRTVFEIKDLTIKKDKEEIELPENLMVQFYAISFSHSRALSATEISPTVYKDHFMLPVIDPAVFLNNQTES